MCRIKKADRQGINEDALEIVNNEKLILTIFVVKKTALDTFVEGST